MRRPRQAQLREYIRVGAPALGKEVLLSPPLPRLCTDRPGKSIPEWFAIRANAAKARRLEFVKFAILSAAKTYCLEMPRLGVKFSQLPSHEAGHVLMRDGIWYIEIDERYRWSDLSLSAIAAHEMAHVVLGLRGVSLQPTIRNEELTDTAAVLAGFGKCLRAACLRGRIVNPVSLLFGVVSVERQYLGYLSRAEFSFVSRIRARIAQDKPVNRWCRIDSQSAAYIPCYACASKLRPPKGEGIFVMRCPVCHMQQQITLRVRNTRPGLLQDMLRYWTNAILEAVDRLRGFETVGSNGGVQPTPRSGAADG